MKSIDKGRAKTNCGTPGYAAPEVMMGIEYNYKVDIWCIGILICEMLGGSSPFQSKEDGDSPLKIIEQCNAGTIKLPKNLSHVDRDIIKNILQADPTLRFEIADIKSHKFFRGIEWDKLAERCLPPAIDPNKLPIPAVLNEKEFKEMEERKTDSEIMMHYLVNNMTPPRKKRNKLPTTNTPNTIVHNLSNSKLPAMENFNRLKPVSEMEIIANNVFRNF